MSFHHIHNGDITKIAGWLGNSLAPMDVDYEIAKWPASIATHPDDFLNDYSINHPAWHTGIAIITETEPDEHTIVCEKTGKGI
jgi:hypothetical protein